MKKNKLKKALYPHLREDTQIDETLFDRMSADHTISYDPQQQRIKETPPPQTSSHPPRVKSISGSIDSDRRVFTQQIDTHMRAAKHARRRLNTSHVLDVAS